MNGLKHSGYISRLLQWISSAGLFFLAIILIIFLGKEIFILVGLLFSKASILTTHSFLESIVTYFLYFEFIALIIMYFKSHYEFPLKYFLHIGITALIRLIIIEHKGYVEVLAYSGSILLLVVALHVASRKVICN
ncbi:phosphate-starvation-inducible protein PsiE [Enterobacter sp. BIDMC 29]|uniref:phosphate-starvation-inducible protein PsiE n=1 Tax=Enterobacter sp. BIDMC 29 TaxID=1329841 RepID=UPI0005A43F2C|nr:phosphate-starvation-inducible protein PsiE [Enterobacter sp. BIDMC 29]